MPDPLLPFQQAIKHEDVPDDAREPMMFTSAEVHELVAEHKGLRDMIDNLRRAEGRLDILKDYLRNYLKLVASQEEGHGYTEEELQEAGKKCQNLFPGVKKFFDDEALEL